MVFIIEMYYITLNCISHTPFIPVTFILQSKVCTLIPGSLLSPSLTLLLFVNYLFVLYESVSVFFWLFIFVAFYFSCISEIMQYLSFPDLLR